MAEEKKPKGIDIYKKKAGHIDDALSTVAHKADLAFLQSVDEVLDGGKYRLLDDAKTGADYQKKLGNTIADKLFTVAADYFGIDAETAKKRKNDPSYEYMVLNALDMGGRDEIVKGVQAHKGKIRDYFLTDTVPKLHQTLRAKTAHIPGEHLTEADIEDIIEYTGARKAEYLDQEQIKKLRIHEAKDLLHLYRAGGDKLHQELLAKNKPHLLKHDYDVAT